MPATTDSRHILSRFDQALTDLRADLLRMASLCEQNFSTAARALATRDEDLCNRVIADDEEVDTLEKKIDAEGISIITRFQPVAHDFRSVFSTMKAATDLERVSDQAVSIARRAKRLLHSLELPETRMLEPLFTTAAGLLRDSIRAFAEENQELGESLKQRDRELDRLQHEFIERITRRMEEDAVNAQGYLDLVLIVRMIERVGDHAVNIGEDSVYAISARDIRHQGDPAP
ncbi:MAG: phosphate signaling complex protein PhoU [Verrucomicrobiaceae bacterium]|nr:phosphate signaling complex protein PhoU [Verrucomicrobiaceae bacterium]